MLAVGSMTEPLPRWLLHTVLDFLVTKVDSFHAVYQVWGEDKVGPLRILNKIAYNHLLTDSCFVVSRLP